VVDRHVHLDPVGVDQPLPAAFSRYASFLAVPLSVGIAAAGFVALARAPGRPVFGDCDITDIAHLAARAGISIANMVRLARHRSITDALLHHQQQPAGVREPRSAHRAPETVNQFGELPPDRNPSQLISAPPSSR